MYKTKNELKSGRALFPPRSEHSATPEMVKAAIGRCGFGWMRLREYRNCARIADVALELCSRMAMRSKSAVDPWAMLGGALAGPLVIGFAERCIKTAEQNGIKNIFFTARDGWLVKKAVEALAGERGLTCRYVYSPRTYSYLLAYEKADLKKHGLDRFLEMIEEAAPGSLPEWKKRKIPAADKRKLVLENWSRLDGKRAHTDAVFRNYIGQLRDGLGGDRKVLLVDGISGQNSAERLYRKYWDAPLFALYFNCDGADGKTRFAYCDGGTSVSPLSFFEFFLSAPTPPIVGISDDGAPLFRSSPQNDRIASVFGRMESGFEAFLAEYTALYSDAEGLFPVDEVIDFFNRYLDTLDDRELALFEDTFLPGNSAESRFLTMADKIYKPFLRIGSTFGMRMRKTESSFVLLWSFRGHSHTLLRLIRR